MKIKNRKAIVFCLCFVTVFWLLMKYATPSHAGTGEAGSSLYGAQQVTQKELIAKVFLSSIMYQPNNINGRHRTPTPVRSTATATATRANQTATPTRVSPTATRANPTATPTLVSPTATQAHLTATPTWVNPTATSANPTVTPVRITPTATPDSTPPNVSGYFVSTTGNDANPGTQSQPWRTITKAGRSATAGVTVYVRGGVYNEQVILSRSGTQDNPIRFVAYPGETPVIEGSGLSIANWSSMLNLAGNWIAVTGFEVRNSPYIGVELSGQHNALDNVYSHHSRETGILARGDYSTVQNSRIWRNALNNEYGAMSGGGWASGLSAARDNVDGKTDYAVLHNNVSWENWGEGVSSFEANGTLIEGNVSYDNYSTNIYISDTTNALCQGNLVYSTPGSYTNGYGAHVGIMMGDEVYKPSSANNTIINNIAYGNRRNFFWWQGDQGGGLVNVLIANNTFVNSTLEAGVVIDQGSHQNARYINNIVVQEGTLPVASIAANTQLTVANNLWSKTPSRAASGAGDVVADPLLARMGSAYTADWYRLLEGSPAINKGQPLAEVIRDYANIARGTDPDIGAFEK
jgi:hypothetical protein